VERADTLGRPLVAVEFTQEELQAVWERVANGQPAHSTPLGQALYKLQNAAHSTGNRVTE